MLPSAGPLSLIIGAPAPAPSAEAGCSSATTAPALRQGAARAALTGPSAEFAAQVSRTCTLTPKLAWRASARASPAASVDTRAARASQNDDGRAADLISTRPPGVGATPRATAPE